MNARQQLAGPATLIIDDILTDPAAAAIVERFRDYVPAWLRDQTEAATAQAHQNLHAASELMGSRVNARPAVEHPQWVRLGALNAMTTWLAGTGSTCLHDPHPDRPQPLFAAAWRPGLVVCSQCSHLLDLPRGSRRDKTCDGCGHVTAGVEQGDPIWPALIQLGLLTYMLGACRGCRYWPDTTEETA